MFNITKSEIIFATIVLSGMILGTTYQYLLTEDVEENKRIEDIFQILDSLAEAQRSTYIGTDIDNIPDSLLALGDTIVKKKSFFPGKKKKALPTGLVNINKASKVQLLKLPGVGEATAMKIVKYREKYGFKQLSDIMKVKGIGTKKFEKMKPSISLE